MILHIECIEESVRLSNEYTIYSTISCTTVEQPQPGPRSADERSRSRPMSNASSSSRRPLAACKSAFNLSCLFSIKLSIATLPYSISN